MTSLDGPTIRCPTHSIEFNGFSPEGCPECAKHKISYKADLLVGMPVLRATCSCGDTWVHEPYTTDEVKNSIFQSHLAYAKRQAMRID